MPLGVGQQLILSGMDFEININCTDTLCVANRSFPTNTTCNCDNEFIDAVLRFREVAWVEGGNTTECLGLLKNTPDIDIVQLKAALLVCGSANALNTFNGLGFDGTNYTLSEFVVPNTGLME